MLEILGLIVAGLVAYVAGRQQTHSERLDQLFSNAFSAAAKLYASRTVLTGIGAENLPDVSSSEREAFLRDSQLDTMRDFVADAKEARAACGAVYPYCREVLPYWDTTKVGLEKEDIDRLIAILDAGRNQQRGLRGLLNRVKLG